MAKWPFSASRLQVATYLLGVALFSISFLVFLNSSVSFVVTNLIKQKHHVGDAVGSLGFADELLALVACPLWGLLSDRIGVRAVCTMGYALVGASLFVFVQAKNVYPQLLLARLFFSLGGAATSTMVTAILPAMTAERGVPTIRIIPDLTGTGLPHPPVRHRPTASASTAATETTITPAARSSSPEDEDSNDKDRAVITTSRTAGLVGMFTGLGALLALAAFLPLPAWLEKSGHDPASSVKYSFYIVGSVAFAVAFACSLGLRWLPGEESKGWRTLLGNLRESEYRDTSTAVKGRVQSYTRLFRDSVVLAMTDSAIALGCLAGFVARASSVAISLFIPLFVNAYFISTGLCNEDPHSPPSEVKKQCRRAYTVAAALTGVSQLIALLLAPLVGYLDGRLRRSNTTLLAGAAVGVISYVTLANTAVPDPKRGGGLIFLTMAFVGVSQICSVVCSLSNLGRGLQAEESKAPGETRVPDAQGEDAPLLATERSSGPDKVSRTRMKGAIAGLSSLFGGAGILLLTKLGGYLFDALSPSAPFYMMAIFNALLFVIGLAITLISQRRALLS